MGKYFQEELERRGLINYIPTMEKIIEAREKGDSVSVTSECKCWSEVSCLDEENYGPVEIWMYAMTNDEGGMIQVRSKDNKLQDTIRIRYCPFCGRYLG